MRACGKFLAKILSWFMSFIPIRFSYYLGLGLAFLWVDIFKIRKKVVFTNLDLAFGQNENAQLNISEKQKIFKSSIVTLARSLFDTIQVPNITTSWIDQNVVFHGVEHIQPDQGYLFLTLHLGSGDLAAACISEKIIPLSLISKRFSSSFFDEFWFSLRTQSKTNFIDAHSSQNAFEILKALKKKRGVVFVLDQYMGKPFGVKTKFFGHETGTAYGLALFAQKTKAPVVPTYTYWGADSKLHICFDPVVEIQDLIVEDKDITLTQITQRFNDIIEDIIKKHPEQWMWVHRRWKKF